MRRSTVGWWRVASCSTLIAAAFLGRCSCEADNDPLWDGTTDVSDTSDPWEGVDLPPDTGADYDILEFESDLVCDEDDFDMHREIIRLMLVLDQSSSMMGDPWEDETAALEAMLLNPITFGMYFGLDAFPDGYPGAWSDCGALCMRCPADSCGYEFPPQVPVSLHEFSAPLITAHMNDPQYPQFCTSTPLVDQIIYYDTGAGPTAAPELYDDEGDSYLVVVSDGYEQNCYGGSDSPASALATHTASILATHGIKSIAIGFGSEDAEMAAQLGAIAANGGSPFPDYIYAPDGDALADTFESIASAVITCTYVLDDVAPTANPDLVNFYVDEVHPDNVIGWDEGCTETTGDGWDWADAAHTTVTFCGPTCDEIKAGTIDVIKATFGCASIII